MKDVARFKDNFKRLTNVFDPLKFTVEVINEYFDALLDLPDWAVDEGISLIIKHWKPEYGRKFPSPSELREYVSLARKRKKAKENIYKAKPKNQISTEKSKKMLDLLKKFSQKKFGIKELREKLENTLKEKEK